MSRLTRSGGVLLFVLLLHTLTTVICEVKVKASVGDSVVLPCVYSEVTPLPDGASVFWRDKDDSVVLNIKRREPDYSSQNQKFKGRVISSSEENVKGNFSIEMSSVQRADGGPYECHIPKVKFQQSVSLTVEEKQVEVEVTKTPPPPRGAGPSGGSTAVTPNILHVLLLLLSLTCSCLK